MIKIELQVNCQRQCMIINYALTSNNSPYNPSKNRAILKTTYVRGRSLYQHLKIKFSKCSYEVMNLLLKRKLHK